MTIDKNDQTSAAEVLTSGSPPIAATLADLKALAGQWSGPSGFAGFSAESGGHLIGHVVLVDDNHVPRLSEMWIFRSEPEGVCLHYKLYTGELKDLQDKDVWAKRWLVGLGSGYIQLENLTLVISDEALDLVARVKPQNEEPRRVEYNFRRVC